jgi:hypothetical protein
MFHSKVSWMDPTTGKVDYFIAKDFIDECKLMKKIAMIQPAGTHIYCTDLETGKMCAQAWVADKNQ